MKTIINSNKLTIINSNKLRTIIALKSFSVSVYGGGQFIFLV